MNTEKPEALRLAEFLEMHWCKVDMPEAKAAAELRRLHQFAEDQIGRATAAEAALQMTKVTHALKIAAVEAQRDALLEACAKAVERARLHMYGSLGLTHETDFIATRITDFLAAQIRASNSDLSSLLKDS
jgi:predicted 2-oxoglutarate/Fe(II)-dependent dioxygenase YbiX